MLEWVYWAAICFGFPAGLLIYSIRKGRTCAACYLAGAAVFILVQPLFRVPILNGVLPYQGWFIRMQIQTPLWVTALFYAFTAGLWEEAGRYAGLRITKMERAPWPAGLLFGLGHGCAEAVWVGWTLARSQAAVSEMNALLCGYERMCTIIVHAGLALLVLEGARQRKLRWLALAIALHTALDLAAVLLAAEGILISEGFLLPCALGAVVWIRHYGKREKRRGGVL